MGERNGFCTQCGAPLEPGDKFCIRCGSSTLRKSPAVETPVEGTPEQALPVKKRRRTVAMIAQIMVMAVAAILGVLLLLPGKENNETVSEMADKSAMQAEADPADETAEEEVEEIAVASADAKYKILGENYQTVIERFEEMGHSVIDGLSADAGINKTVSERRAGWLQNLGRYTADIPEDAAIYMAEDAGNNPFLWVLIFVKEDVVIAYHVVLDMDVALQTSLAECRKESDFYEIRNLKTEPEMKTLLGQNSNGNPWDHEFNGRLVYTEEEYSVQFHAMKYDGATGEMTSDPQRMHIVEFYVQDSLQTANSHKETSMAPELETKLIGNMTCVGELVYRPSEAGYYCLNLDEPLKLDCGHSYTDLWLLGNYDGELNDYVDKTVQIQGELHEDEGRGIAYMYGDSAISLVEAKNETENVLKGVSPITVIGVAGYSSEPSDIGEEYCFVKSHETISYMYEALGGEWCQGQSDTLYVINEDIPKLREYVGQQVIVSGEFASECHGIPYIINVKVQPALDPADIAIKQTGYPAYDAKIYEYFEAIAMSDEAFDETYSQLDFGRINSYLIMLYRSSSDNSQIAYTLYDVNKDGTPELVFAYAYGEGAFDIIDLYSLNDGNLVTSEWDASLGYRSHLYILSDGNLLWSGSSGASSGLCELYGLTFDGYAMPLESYYFDEMSGPSDYMDDRYEYVSLDECVEKEQTWMEKAIDLDQLTWNALNGK